MILPVWYQINAQELSKYSLYLTDKLAISAEKNFDTVASKIIKVVRPDIFRHQAIKRALDDAIQTGRRKQVPVSQ